MLQTRKTLSRKLQIFSAIALVGMPFLIYGTAITPEHAEAASTTLNDISTMQEMTADICSNSKIGDSKPLTDTRDNKQYTVAKLHDGNCWMTQNLAFDITQAINPMSTSNSDVVPDWSWSTTPTRYTTGTGWSTDNTAVAYITNPTVDSSYAGDGGGYQSSYGYYYSWCAATAGCQDASGNNPGANVDAASSICPKGWKLPAGTPGTGTNDFAKVVGLASTNIAAGTNYWSSLSSPSFANKTLTVNGSTWLAAGYVNPGRGLRNPGTYGNYWSRTAYSTTYGYRLYFSSGDLYPAHYTNRYFGFSVRCVAYSEPHDSGNVNVSVASTITIDATAGMTSEVEATTPATGNITARISANTPYKVLLGASTSNPGNKTSLYRRTDDMQEGTTPTYDVSSNNYIPTVSGNASVAPSTVEANTNAWGISNSCNKDGSGLAYLPITTTQKEYCGSSIDEATLDSATGQNIHTFGIGISVSSSLASGTYETNVTVTGVAN